MSRKNNNNFEILLTNEQMFTIINSTTIESEANKITERIPDMQKFAYPSEEEMSAAQRACCGRVCHECETPAAYAWRKREVDMAILLENAIQNELSKSEREIVIDHWFNFLSKTQIAQKRDISRSAVSKAIKRSVEKLERVLKYAFYYQQDICSESIIPLALGRARVIAAARNAVGGNSGDRILRLRQSQCLSREMLSRAVQISANRLEAIERGAEVKADEVLSFSIFFNVTSDYILKGESDDRK